MKKQEWQEFIEKDLLLIFKKYNLKKIDIDDGTGNSATIRKYKDYSDNNDPKITLSITHEKEV